MASSSHDLPVLMNLLAGTTGLEGVVAANVYAGTTRLEEVEALNKKAGTTGLSIGAALSKIAGIAPTEAVTAAEKIQFPSGNYSTRPGRPTVVYVRTSTAYVLNWTAVSGTFYRVFRSPDNVNWDILATVAGGTTTYADTVAAGATFSYRVSANSDVYETFSSTAGVFGASTITGMAAWYDASTASSITSAGGLVTQLNDLSDNGLHLVAAGTARPTTGANTINGLNTIDFNGTANVLKKTSVSVTATNAMTVFLVLYATATSAFERFFSLNDASDDFSNATSIAAILRDNTNLGVSAYYHGAQMNSKAMTNNTAHQVTSQRNGDSHIIRVDGSAGTTKTGLGTANFGITIVSLGAYASGIDGGFGTFRFGEAIWVNGVSSASDLALTEATLKAKWATP